MCGDKIASCHAAIATTRGRSRAAETVARAREFGVVYSFGFSELKCGRTPLR
jgi:hypothetical protein